MFDIGWPEMAVIMLVAIIVIGPKDLPRMARTIGKWTGKARSMARDFQRSLDDMAREADLDDIKKSIDKVGTPNRMKSTLTSSIRNAVDPDDELADGLKIEDDKPKPAKVGVGKAESTKAVAAETDTEAASPAKSSTAGNNAVPGFSSGKSAEAENKNEA